MISKATINCLALTNIYPQKLILPPSVHILDIIQYLNRRCYKAGELNIKTYMICEYFLMIIIFVCAYMDVVTGGRNYPCVLMMKLKNMSILVLHNDKIIGSLY
jgi:hypothetical protein